MNKRLIRTKIEEAEQQLTTAEQEFSEAIRALRAVPRAEKTLTSTLVENALGKLSASKAKVVELKTLLDLEDDA
jgi:flagellar biosynthesis chaperone FliJ